ncbi:NAD(P)/FAD-dependent oxidoreductase [Bergeriella denitrificans]|uniref:D-amino acid dehydrogenase small subunit n=1 Tax=Bergeriella denitrificans TaxID=494 RepID=A0A378UJA9_BERDE|nr:FAD-dependent oxidoreductase [Bergeriella denitrificans]STZ77426.1 D-amino acid dehydrogenase small subunit [Bergeriella denitrificans]
MNTHTYDMAVVGGGIIGLGCALALQQAGVKTLVLEKERLCGGTSRGNAGHIATEQVFPIASPEVLKQLPAMLSDPLGPLRMDWRYLPRIAPWFLQLLYNLRPARFEATCQALQALNGKSLAAWQDWARNLLPDNCLHVRGSLLVAETQAGAEALRRHGGRLAAMGVENRWLPRGELLAAEPALSACHSGGLFYPQTGHIADLAKLSDGLKRHFLESGGTVCEQEEVCALETAADGIHRISGTRGAYRARHLLLAAGAFSKQWCKRLTGVSVPLETERGYHLMLPHMHGTLSVPVTSYERRFIMTPMDGGLRLAGTVEFAGLDAPPKMERAHNLLKLAAPMLRQDIRSDGAAAWMGFRPSTADSLPVIDRHGTVLLAFGHQHLGLTHAPLTAQLVKALYFGTPPAVDLRPYRLGRFA